MIPKLAALVSSYEGEATADKRWTSPEAAAIAAVADALIRLDATLPADVVMHLYPRFPAQTIILLSRASDNPAPLMEIFRQTKSRDLWLAAGNLLAVHPPPGFVRALLGGAVTTFSFRVVWTGTEAGFGCGGCASDYFMRPDENFRDWPKVRMYRIIHGENAPNAFAPGIHPVGFSWRETTNYQDAWEDGDCSEGARKYWRIGLIAQLLGKKMSDLALQPAVAETVLFTSPTAFEERVRSAIDRQQRAFGEVAGAFVQSGELTVEDAAALHLQCRIKVEDNRPLPYAVLPEVTGRWCTAPSADADSRLP
jgi:flavin-binding protein dodecin